MEEIKLDKLSAKCQIEELCNHTSEVLTSVLNLDKLESCIITIYK